MIEIVKIAKFFLKHLTKAVALYLIAVIIRNELSIFFSKEEGDPKAHF